METACHPDLVVADDGESYVVTGQVSAGELPGRRLREAWRNEGIVSQLELDALDGSGRVRAFLMGDGSVRLAEERRRNGHGRRRNPASSAEQYGAAQAVLSGQSDIMPPKIAREIVDRTPAALRSQYASELAARRRNPEEGAVALAETWYGRPVETVTEYVDEVHVHRHSADLGRLVELEVFPVGDSSGERVVPLAFRPSENVRLAANEDGTQLFLVGAVWLDDRTLGKFGLGTAERNKELVSLGKVHSISYHAAKHTHQFRPADYIHEMGERSGYLPDLIWSRPNQELILSGGSYTVQDVGIVN